MKKLRGDHGRFSSSLFFFANLRTFTGRDSYL